MSDIKHPTLIWIKGLLFLILGFIAVGLLLAMAPSLQIAVLLLIAIWSFCRFYYFAFYVIQHYVDPTYRFAGLLDFVQYTFGRRDQKNRRKQTTT